MKRERESSATGLLTPRSVTWSSIIADTVLTICKVAAGLVCASQAILADGLHSASDLITDIAVLAGMKVAQRPADGSHPYGHRRVTTLVAMFVGAVLLAAGGWIIYNAIVNIQRSKDASISANVPFWIAVAAVPIKELLYQITRYVGRRESDISLLANAWHHRTDAVTSIAAAAGLAGILLGGPSWYILDSLTALVLSAFLLVVATRIILFSASELIDRAPGQEVLSGIERAVSDTDGVRSFHAVRARHVGGKVEMDVHVRVEPDLTVRQGHDIASAVEGAVKQADRDVLKVTVHVEPAREDAG